MSTASLTVRIAGDINDFSRKLTAMTRDVDRAAKKISDIGKAMTIGITLPVGLAAAALTKMALDNDRTAARMKGSFGPAAEEMNAHLERLQKLVPVAGTELQKMAVDVNNFGRGLGMAAPKAALLSENVLKMAADLSAKTGMEMPEALDALVKGLEGSTRGLKGMGIVISEGQIKNEAYRLGLVASGRELTPLGTALATYSLLVKQSSQFTGAAAQMHQVGAQKVAMFRTAASELADKLSNLLVPALTKIAQFGSALIGVLDKIPSGVWKAAFAVAAFAAAVGPALVAGAKLVAVVNMLRAAFTLFAAGEGIATIVAALAAPEVIAGIAVLVAALGGLAYLWHKVNTEADATPVDPFATMLDGVKKMMGGVTSMSSKDPLQQFSSDATDLVTSFDRAIEVGDNYQRVLEKIGNAANEAGMALTRLGERGIFSGKEVNAYAEAYDKLTAAQRTAKGIIALPQPNLPDQVRRAAGSAKSDLSVQKDVQETLVQGENMLRFREEMLKTTSTLDAMRVATVELKERLRGASDSLATTIASIKAQTSSPKALGASVVGGLQEGLAGALAGLGPFALAVAAVGKVMQGLQPLIDAVLQPLADLGAIIAIELTPVLRPLFQVLKVFGIVTSLCAEVVYRAASGIARVVGGIISAIGRLISKIPFLGGIGSGIQRVGDSLLTLSDSFSNTADDLKEARKKLIDSTLDQASAANKAAEALLNVPTGYKVALARFRATDPIGGSGPSSSVMPASGNGAANRTGPAGSGSQTINLVLDGKTVATVVVNNLRSIASAQKGLDANWYEAEPV